MYHDYVQQRVTLVTFHVTDRQETIELWDNRIMREGRHFTSDVVGSTGITLSHKVSCFKNNSYFDN